MLSLCPRSSLRIGFFLACPYTTVRVHGSVRRLSRCGILVSSPYVAFIQLIEELIPFVLDIASAYLL